MNNAEKLQTPRLCGALGTHVLQKDAWKFNDELPVTAFPVHPWHSAVVASTDCLGPDQFAVLSIRITLIRSGSSLLGKTSRFTLVLP